MIGVSRSSNRTSQNVSRKGKATVPKVLKRLVSSPRSSALLSVFDKKMVKVSRSTLVFGEWFCYDNEYGEAVTFWPSPSCNSFVILSCDKCPLICCVIIRGSTSHYKESSSIDHISSLPCGSSTGNLFCPFKIYWPPVSYSWLILFLVQ